MNLAVIPLGHSYGLGNLAIPLVMQGTAMVCAASPLPQALANVCAQWRPTVFPAVPALLRTLAQADVARAKLGSLRLVISAGAPLAPEVAAAFETKFGRAVHGFYGTSETGGISFDRTGEATRAGRSVGTPMQGVTLTFGRGRRFAVSSVAVGGRGTFRPADRGALNELGELALLGRAGRTVKIAARRVDLGEIERALRAVEGVRDAFAMAHPHRADALAAAVCSERAATEIRRDLSKRVPAWKVPERLVVCADFPTTARGKPNTRALRGLLGQQ
jgi:acyl-coenzyme A synthetase/AMP-(fatty) acid ligase